MPFFVQSDIDLDVINIAFPNLVINDLYLLKKYVFSVIEYLANRFNFNPLQKPNYIYQFKKDKGRDIISIVLMLIPFIKDESYFKSIVTLEQIWKSDKYSNRKIDCENNENISSSEYLEENFILLKRSIDMCSNKLYVNWITIRPISLTEYKSLPSYTNLVEWFKNQDHESGLYLGDIYNTIVNDLYLNIKDIKWLLYEVKDKGTIISFEEVFRKIDDFDTLISFFTTKINTYAYSENVIIQLVKYALVFFENYYPINKLVTELNYKPFNVVKFLKLEEDRTDDFDISTITSDNILERLRLLGSDLFFSYRDDVLRKFNYTWYSKVPHIIKTVPADTVQTPIYLTRKNIYHFAKSVFHKSKTDWTPQSKLWSELDEYQQNYIIKTKLHFNADFEKWFSIKGNLKRLYNDNLVIISTYILQEIYDSLADIIHESLIFKGVLSIYQPNVTINLESKQSIKENIYSILADSTKDYSSCYYYITGEKYEQNYLDGMKNKPDENNWFYTYAMDWLSQLNFYHHTINNRICFITGSTGVGKSTQAPKLIMYAYRMLFYNNTVKILCSQPRIPPTIGNASRISQELGVIIDKEEK